MSIHKKENKVPAHNLRFIKMLAQMLGILVCGFFLVFIFGEGIPDISNDRGNELISFLPFLLAPIIGFIITWFYESTGAVIMILGGLAIMGYNFYYHDAKAAFIYGLPFIFIALIFFWHMKKRDDLKRSRRRQ